MIRVSLAQGEGPVSTYTMERGSTVEDLLELADVDLGSRKVKVNGESADGDTTLHENDLVILVQKVTGGSLR